MAEQIQKQHIRHCRVEQQPLPEQDIPSTLQSVIVSLEAELCLVRIDAQLAGYDAA